MTAPQPQPTTSMTYGPSITLETARAVAAAAEAEARKHNWTVVIAIVDTGGHLVFLERIDGTQTASTVIAQEKARTAASFKRATKLFQEMITGGATPILGLTGVLPLAGGVPLTRGGQIIGAIGVSGVQSHEDHVVAEAGAAVLAG